jgi:hypothetical protein
MNHGKNSATKCVTCENIIKYNVPILKINNPSIFIKLNNSDILINKNISCIKCINTKAYVDLHSAVNEIYELLARFKKTSFTKMFADSNIIIDSTDCVKLCNSIKIYFSHNKPTQQHVNNQLSKQLNSQISQQLNKLSSEYYTLSIDSLNICMHSKHKSGMLYMYVKRNDLKKYKTTATITSKKTLRTDNLVDQLKNYKLFSNNYNKNALCASYINNGSPPVDEIITQLREKQQSENDRLCELLETLQSYNLRYEDNVPAYKKYISKGGDILDIIESGELEKELILTTDYLSIHDHADSDTAKELAITSSRSVSDRANRYINNKVSIIFD